MKKLYIGIGIMAFFTGLFWWAGLNFKEAIIGAAIATVASLIAAVGAANGNSNGHDWSSSDQNYTNPPSINNSGPGYYMNDIEARENGCFNQVDGRNGGPGYYM